MSSNSKSNRVYYTRFKGGSSTFNMNRILASHRLHRVPVTAWSIRPPEHIFLVRNVTPTTHESKLSFLTDTKSDGLACILRGEFSMHSTHDYSVSHSPVNTRPETDEGLLKESPSRRSEVACIC